MTTAMTRRNFVVGGALAGAAAALAACAGNTPEPASEGEAEPESAPEGEVAPEVENPADLVLKNATVYTIDDAWTIASASGIAVLAVILIGAAAAASDRSILSDVLGLLTAFLTALVYEYFVLGLDYRGTERVQFEDDDYYYYVKAVPKLKPENEEERFV